MILSEIAVKTQRTPDSRIWLNVYKGLWESVIRPQDEGTSISLYLHLSGGKGEWLAKEVVRVEVWPFHLQTKMGLLNPSKVFLYCCIGLLRLKKKIEATKKLRGPLYFPWTSGSVLALKGTSRSKDLHDGFVNVPRTVSLPGTWTKL